MSPRNTARHLMKTRLSLFALLLGITAFTTPAIAGERVSLFDGKSFHGWTGDTNKTWRIQEGAFAAGSLKSKFPRNEFLRTTRLFTNFVLRLKVKLTGTEGFVNGGVQVRSQPATMPPNEMVGYQADVGAGWWGALYDETRRNKILVKPRPEDVEKAVRDNEWNDYEIRCVGKRIQSAINGVPMIDYTEPDDAIPQFGLLGLQIHGNGVTEVFYKDITVEELP
jgi:hypothetical protein